MIFAAPFWTERREARGESEAGEEEAVVAKVEHNWGMLQGFHGGNGFVLQLIHGQAVGLVRASFEG